jgi:cellulose biosynthesis protein BcsQ
MKLILIANLAGGVGKTALTQGIATAASEYGKRALAIDATFDGALTFLSGVENPRFTLLECATDPGKLETAVTKTADRYSLLPGASRVSGLAKIPASFKDALQDFDLVVVDSASGPNRVLPLLIEITDRIISPIDGAMVSFRGALHLRRFIDRATTKPKIDLVLNAKRSETALEFAREEFVILEPEVRSDVEVAKSQLGTRSALSESATCDFASDVRELTYALLEDFAMI